MSNSHRLFAPIQLHNTSHNTMSTIKAAIIKQNPQIGELAEISTKVPFPEINDNQILVKAVAYAANPTDWKHVLYIKSPAGSILGSDVAGVVEKVGSKVTHFAVGDNVGATLRGNIDPNRGGFSEYVAIDENAALKLDVSGFSSSALPVGTTPSGPVTSFEAGASVTLGLATVSLSFAHNFKLSKDSGKTILIWGGATASGVLAIQVAKLVFGLKVITTASKKHHEWLKSLGADATFDYRESDVTDQIINYAKGSIAYGYDTVSDKETYQQLYDSTKGSDSVKLDNLLFLGEEDIKTDSSRNVEFYKTLVYVINGKDHYFGPTLVPSDPQLLAEYNHLWFDVLPAYLPKLKSSNLKVLEPGFESVDDALKLLYDNKASGEKIVFRFA